MGRGQNNPADPSAVLRVWRAPGNNFEDAVEISYGFDGRVQRIDAYDFYDAVPALVGEYRWGPLEVDRLFESTEIQDDDTYETSRMAWDVGGYFGALSDAFVDQALVSPVLGVDEAKTALRSTMGISMPEQIAPVPM